MTDHRPPPSSLRSYVPTPRGRLLGCALGALLLCGPASSASYAKSTESSKKGADQAKKDQVKKLFADGMSLYDLRKFDEAITTFENAFKLYPDPVFLYNIAQAHRMAGHTVDAIAFYKNYVRKVPSAPNIKEVNDWIAQLEKGPQVAAPPPVPPLSPMPPPQPYLEPKSKHSFLTRMPFDGKWHTLTGVSRRSYIGFLLYAVGMYVEEEPARRAYPKLVDKAGGSDLVQLRARDLAQNFVILGEFGKVAVLYFTRNLKAGQIRDSYHDMLKGNLKPETAPTLRQHTEQFLALFNRDMQSGEEMQIQTTSDGHINVTSASIKQAGPVDPTLCIDLWNLWIGTKPISEELKQGLVERIQALSPPATPATPPAPGK